MTEFDLQEVFDTVATHLIKQGERSTSGTLYCKYRGDNGTKCAIGVLIKEEFYNADIEGCKATQVPVVIALSKSLKVDVTSIYANSFPLSDLQKIHDETKPDMWSVKLKEFAKVYSLALPDVLLKP